MWTKAIIFGLMIEQGMTKQQVPNLASIETAIFRPFDAEELKYEKLVKGMRGNPMSAYALIPKDVTKEKAKNDDNDNRNEGFDEIDHDETNRVLNDEEKLFQTIDIIEKNYNQTIQGVMDSLNLQGQNSKLRRSTRIKKIMNRWIGVIKQISQIRKCWTQPSDAEFNEIKESTVAYRNVGQLFDPIFDLIKFSIEPKCKNVNSWYNRLNRVKKLTRDVKTAARQGN